MFEKLKSSAEDTTKTVVQREQSLRWEVAQAQSEIGKLRNRLAELQTANQVLESTLMKERQRYNELEIVVSRARTGEAQALIAQKNQAKQLDLLLSREESKVKDSNIHETECKTGNNEAENKSDNPYNTMSFDVTNRSQPLNVQEEREKHDNSEATSGTKNAETRSHTNSLSTAELEEECNQLECMIAEQSDVIRAIQKDAASVSNFTESIEENLEQRIAVLRDEEKDIDE